MKLSGVFKAILFIPVLSSVVVAGIVFRMMFSELDGALMNQVRELFGLSPIIWLKGEWTAMPVAGGELRFAPVAKALGFAALAAENLTDLPEALRWARQAAGEGSCLLEILLRQGSRTDLGRPTQTPKENLRALTQALRGEAER